MEIISLILSIIFLALGCWIVYLFVNMSTNVRKLQERFARTPDETIKDLLLGDTAAAQEKVRRYMVDSMLKCYNDQFAWAPDCDREKVKAKVIHIFDVFIDKCRKLSEPYNITLPESMASGETFFNAIEAAIPLSNRLKKQ